MFCISLALSLAGAFGVGFMLGRRRAVVVSETTRRTWRNRGRLRRLGY